MVAVVAEDAIRKPAHPSGESWPVAWAAPDGRAIFADSISEIVEQIIPGYADLADDAGDAHLEARVATLAHLGGQAQAGILAQERDETFSEDELTAMLTSKELPPAIDSWNPATPLILLTTHYQPFTDASAPEGTVIWLDPATEVTFLSGLQTLGFGELWVLGG